MNCLLVPDIMRNLIMPFKPHVVFLLVKLYWPNHTYTDRLNAFTEHRYEFQEILYFNANYDIFFSLSVRKTKQLSRVLPNVDKFLAHLVTNKFKQPMTLYSNKCRSFKAEGQCNHLSKICKKFRIII